MNATLRPAVASDEDFLRTLILDTIAGDLGASSWPEPMRSHLLQVQYSARRQLRHGEFPDAIDQVIRVDGVDAGWILVNPMPHEIRLVEIMVRPEMRGKGIGGAIIRKLLTEASDTGKPLRLRVNATNHGAIRLYRSLGFRRIDGDEVQHLMEGKMDVCKLR